MNVATVIVINDRPRGFVIRPVSTGDRLLARLRAGSLDRRLAAGTAPEAGSLLALRADAIVRPATRNGLARQLQRILLYPANPGRHRPLALSGSTCRNVLNAADVLGHLVERLQSPCPVSARGTVVLPGPKRRPRNERGVGDQRPGRSRDGVTVSGGATGRDGTHCWRNARTTRRTGAIQCPDR